MKTLLAILLSLSMTVTSNSATTGTFTSSFDAVDGIMYYQFKSYDDSVWWALTEEQIGKVPTIGKGYVLTYHNNNTTAANKPCDCLPEWDCECEVYDDIFVSIYEIQ